MNSVFLVRACVDYEGESPVRAFADSYEAQEFARICREYHAARPAWPDSDLSEESIDRWSAAEKAWSAAHPAGDVGSPDHFDVVEVQFGQPEIATKPKEPPHA